MASTIVSCSLDTLPCAAATADSRLRIRATNAAFVERWQALGADPTRLDGGSLSLLCAPEKRMELQRALWRYYVRPAEQFSLSLTAPRVILDLAPIKASDDACWLVTFRESLGSREPSSNRMVIAALAHDLKMPVQAVLGWVSLLRRKKVDNERLDDVLGILERNARLEADMLNELLEVASLPGDKPPRRLSRVDVGNLLRSTIEALRPLAEEARIQLSLRACAAPATVAGNPKDLTRIVGNLIANAIKFSESGGVVECEISREADWVRLVVHDQGRGISAKFLPHVFDSFRREGRPELLAQKGIGIGLTAVRDLVERHGGSVRAESKGRGHGATFTVMLPRFSRRARLAAVNRSAAADSV